MNNMNSPSSSFTDDSRTHLCRHAKFVWNFEFHISLIVCGFSSFNYPKRTLFPLKQADTEAQDIKDIHAVNTSLSAS